MFAGAYQGHFDATPALPGGADPDAPARPLASGIAPNMVADALVLLYGEAASLETLRARAGELAAILVEPVQSRRPDLQPREFLHALREIATESGAALIFDEIVTGFRIAPGGSQEWFSLRADDFPPGRQRLLKLAVTGVGLFMMFALVRLSLGQPEPPPLPEGYGGYREVGIAMYTDYVLLVEVASLLLTAAIVGALILAKRKIS